MRTAQRTKGRMAKVATMKTLPPPVDGLNTRDALASMKATEARTLDNIYPFQSHVEFVGGYTEHTTSTVGWFIKTLAVYNGLNGTNTMWALGAGGINNVTAGGTPPASALGRTQGIHQYTMFGDGTKNWLIAVNGTDDPAYYDGTTWMTVDELTSPALTGYTGNAVEQFINVNVFKGRLFFIPKDSLSFWYLPAGVAGGALTEFNLAGEAPAGGYLMAMATWTRDAGSGPDDFAVFITSAGDCIVYQGTNPSSATTWAKVGSFKVGRPLGRKCFTPYGADVLVMTEDGVFPLSGLLASGEERAKYAFSYKVQPLVTDYAQQYLAANGWQCIVYPKKEALIVNMPNDLSFGWDILAMNTVTKAWCKISGWLADHYAVFNGELYSCYGGQVWKVWDSTTENGGTRQYICQQAYSTLGDPQSKHVKLIAPYLELDADNSVSVGVGYDFIDYTGIGSTSINDDETVYRKWTMNYSHPARWLSVRLRAQTTTMSGKWLGTAITYESGDGL